jgi:hypothetical protein
VGRFLQAHGRGRFRMSLKRWFHRVVLSRHWLTFLVMGVSFLVFGAGTVNLLMLFKANTDLIATYGWQALMDGAAHQLAELVVTGYLSMAAYVVFKTCEHRLTHALAEPEAPVAPARPAAAAEPGAGPSPK